MNYFELELALTAIAFFQASWAQTSTTTRSRIAHWCLDPPYVSCAHCAAKPWPVETVGNKLTMETIPTKGSAVITANLRIYEVGESVYYKEKDATYDLIGNTTITCLAGGMWSKPPTCQQYCITMPSVQNATCDAPDSGIFKINDRANCRCNPGYIRMTGFINPTCQKNNTWTGPLKCQLRVTTTPTISGCTDLPTIQYGVCGQIGSGAGASGLWKIGEPVECQCNPGYYVAPLTSEAIRQLRLRSRREAPEMVTKQNATCNSTSKWNNLPMCIPIIPVTQPATCPNPPTVANAGCERYDNRTINEIPPFNFYVGDTVLYTCRSGFATQNNPIITCLSSGRWSVPPVCLPANTTKDGCRGYPVVPLGSCQMDEEEDDDEDLIVERGQTVTCICDDDDITEMTGSPTVTCLRSGWSAVPNCRPITLPPSCSLATLGNVANGYCESALEDGATQFSPGEQVVCDCDDGYVASNQLEDGEESMITCTKTGVWSGDMPTCVVP